MNIKHTVGPFEAEITGDLLTARFFHNSLFTCRLQQLPWFVMHSDGLYAQNAHDALSPLYRGENAGQLLECLTLALSAVENRRMGRIRLTFVAGLLAGLAILALAYSVLTSTSDAMSTSKNTAPLTYRSSAASSDMPLNTVKTRLLPAEEQLIEPASKPGLITSTDNVHPSLQTPDNWTLPVSVRASLPAKLKQAAARGLFTVPLSSGHARTLYVFADPECPNCQRMERLYEGASGLVNVVIFPVTIEGGADSLKALAPVMAMSEAARPAAWKRLFSADAGIKVPGSNSEAGVSAADDTSLETARAALGVNEVAFRAYRLPGTPWTISDDGRYVPQAALNSPDALQTFLNEGAAHDAQ